MPGPNIVYLPEAIIEEHLGRPLANAVPQEFTYDGHRYRAMQRDPSKLELQVPCELIDEPAPKKKTGRRLLR